MSLRRAIAAFLTFAFATLLCAPAFAGVWALSSTPEKGCCCSKKEETRHVTVGAEKCSCPACACTIGDAQPLAPLHTTTPATGIATFAIMDQPSMPPDVAAMTSRDDVVPGARGPPEDASPPLYILYDTLLI